MRRAMLAIVFTLISAATAESASADVRVRIDMGSQTMHVYVGGALYYEWPVSTGRGRYGTPTGTFMPQRLERHWYSTKYPGASMHNAIFFHRGYAIHATTEVRRLGHPASHGCVRLAPQHAAALFSLVRKQGSAGTRITITR